MIQPLFLLRQKIIPDKRNKEIVDTLERLAGEAHMNGYNEREND